MKANEAPKKIYLTKNLLGELRDGRDALPSEELFNIEYIRKDALIKKACNWLLNNLKNYSTNELGAEYLIEDLKKYLEE